MGSEQPETNLDVRSAGGEVHLVRDVLDTLLVDRNHDPLGRVDGLVLGIAADGRPEVLCIEAGVTVLAGRLGRAPGRWVRTASRRWGLRGGKPWRVPWAKVIQIGIETELDLDAERTEALVWEDWLRRHVVRYLPSIKPRDKDKDDEQQKERHEQGAQQVSPTPGDQASTIKQPALSSRVRVHKLLGRRVLDVNGQPAGRVEEVRADARDGRCLVDAYVLGREALLERLSVYDLSLAAVRMLGARHGAAGHRVPWQQMDLSVPHRPRLKCTLEELKAADDRAGDGAASGG